MFSLLLITMMHYDTKCKTMMQLCKIKIVQSGESTGSSRKTFFAFNMAYDLLRFLRRLLCLLNSYITAGEGFLVLL